MLAMEKAQWDHIMTLAEKQNLSIQRLCPCYEGVRSLICLNLLAHSQVFRIEVRKRYEGGPQRPELEESAIQIQLALRKLWEYEFDAFPQLDNWLNVGLLMQVLNQREDLMRLHVIAKGEVELHERLKEVASEFEWPPKDELHKMIAEGGLSGFVWSTDPHHNEA